jgi:hypothetical protein
MIPIGKYCSLRLLSLLLLLTLVTLWGSAILASPEHALFLFRCRGVIVQVDRGGFEVIGGPASAPASAEAIVRAALARVHNSDITFACAAGYGREERRKIFGAQVEVSTQIIDLENLTDVNGRPLEFNAYKRPLLEALEDPDKFIAAHVLLVRQTTPSARIDLWLPARFQDGVYTFDLHGLPIRLPPPDEKRNYTRRGPPSALFWLYSFNGERPARADTTQFPALRDHWHVVLGPYILVIPYWVTIILAGILPVRWAVYRVRSLIRRRQNRCPHCGYDVRASIGCCPECGTSIS